MTALVISLFKQLLLLIACYQKYLFVVLRYNDEDTTLPVIRLIAFLRAGGANARG